MEQEHNTWDRWLSVEEEIRLFHSAAPWPRELMVFALHSGMRQGAILDLAWEWVDLFRRTAVVFKSKNGTRRTIPLNQTTLDLLTHKYGRRSGDTALVFASDVQTRLNGSNIGRGMRLLLDKAKITDFHFHDLLHTCATRMVQAGVDLYKVQRLLGHKSPIMTQALCASLSGKSARWGRGVRYGAGAKVVTPEQIELSRLRAANVRLKRENDILNKGTAGSSGESNTRLQYSRWRLKSQCLSRALIQPHRDPVQICL